MHYLVRLGADIIIKSDRIRARFVGRLIFNLRQAFAAAGIKAEIQRGWSRLVVVSDQPEALDVIRRIYGVSTIAAIEHRCSSDFDEIIKCLGQHYAEKVKGKTFAVRVKRVGKHPYTSMDIARQGGSAIYEESSGVRLKNPEVEVFVEVRENEAVFYSERHKGPGGLPLGVSGKVLCLFSGGFDSAVAAWMMQKRGIEVDYLFCNLAGSAYEKSVLSLAKFMTEEWSAGSSPHIYIVNMIPVADEIRKKVKPAYAQIMLKRAFYRLAESIAGKIRADAILTGECIGQVSSQTLPNLRAIEHVVELPVLRPLLGYDKDDIIQFSRRIGTYAISSGVVEYCQLVPDKPATACSIATANKQEMNVDLSILNQALAEARKIDLVGLNPADLVTPYLYCEEIRESDRIIDCRSEESFATWHLDGAENIEFYELLTDQGKLSKKESYVLYCPVGLQSAVLAEKLQKLGFNAHSFRGGINGLKKYLGQ